MDLVPTLMLGSSTPSHTEVAAPQPPAENFAALLLPLVGQAAVGPAGPALVPLQITVPQNANAEPLGPRTGQAKTGVSVKNKRPKSDEASKPPEEKIAPAPAGAIVPADASAAAPTPASVPRPTSTETERSTRAKGPAPISFNSGNAATPYLSPAPSANATLARAQQSTIRPDPLNVPAGGQPANSYNAAEPASPAAEPAAAAKIETPGKEKASEAQELEAPNRRGTILPPSAAQPSEIAAHPPLSAKAQATSVPQVSKLPAALSSAQDIHSQASAPSIANSGNSAELHQQPGETSIAQPNGADKIQSPPTLQRLAPAAADAAVIRIPAAVAQATSAANSLPMSAALPLAAAAISPGPKSPPATSPIANFPLPQTPLPRTEKPAAAAASSVHNSVDNVDSKLALSSTTPDSRAIAHTPAKVAESSRQPETQDSAKADSARKDSAPVAADSSQPKSLPTAQAAVANSALATNPAVASPPGLPIASTLPHSSVPGGRADVPAPENPAPLPTASPVILHSTRLVESLSGSELRVGMKMGDLGNVEIRTQLEHQQLKTEISVEHQSLVHALAGELPALQQRLSDQNLPLTAVVVHQQSAGNPGGFAQGQRQQHPAPAAPGLMAAAGESNITISSPEDMHETAGALDVRI
jgi:Flagellar hook-length control protein FliK